MVVHEVRWRTDTLARLDAALVLLTIIIPRALDTGHETAGGEWISGIAGRTTAFKPAYQVVALCIEGTAGASVRLAHSTLIHILAGAVSPRSEALGTCTVAETALDGDTLCTRGTLIAQGAVGQHTVTLHNAVWWQTGTF